MATYPGPVHGITARVCASFSIWIAPGVAPVAACVAQANPGSTMVGQQCRLRIKAKGSHAVGEVARTKQRVPYTGGTQGNGGATVCPSHHSHRVLVPSTGAEMGANADEACAFF